MEAYILIVLELLNFLYCKICETCRPGSGPKEDWQLAPRHEDAEILQRICLFGLFQMTWVENSFCGVSQQYDWVCLWANIWEGK
jgi:hypothetical protein